MFVGRENNLEDMQALWKKRTSSLVAVSGRRRIGKSTLVARFAAESKCRFIEIAGLAPDREMTNQKQIDHFCERLAVVTGTPEAKCDGWAKAFDALAVAIKGSAKTIVFLDEVSWMGKYDPSFAALLKDAWDTKFARRPNLVFVLAASVSAWIQENILNARAFVGRISLDLRLGELTLAQCRQFWGKAATRVSEREILDMLSVTGGIPKYLEEIDPSLSVEENVRRMCFSPNGYLFKDFDAIFNDVFQSSVHAKRAIVSALADGPASVSEIAERAQLELNGHISRDLADLCDAGFVASSEGLNPSTGKPARETRYRLMDNYVRFYLKYIEPKKGAIKAGLYRFTSLENLAGWDVILGFQFENLVLNHLPVLAPRLGLGTAVVTSAAPYYRKGRTRDRGVQVDLLIQTNRSVCVVEIKRRLKVTDAVEDEVEAKLERLKVRKGISKRTALVYAGSLSQKVVDDGYFDFIVSVEDLLNESIN